MRTTQGQTAQERKRLSKVEREIREQHKRARERLDAVRTRQLTDQDILRRNAIITGLLPRIQTAIDAWANKRVPMSVDLDADHFTAMTDFKKITLSIPEGDVSLDFVGDLRGLAYHEAGHILRTIPLPDLIAAVDESDPQRMTWRINEWLVDTHGLTLYQVQPAWNIIEDQRMETGMVRRSKNLASYYNVIVLTHVLAEGINETSHLWLYGRTHVDADVRAAARHAMIEGHGLDTVEAAEQIIRDYMAADNTADMLQGVIDFARLLDTLQARVPQIDTHSTPSTPMEGDAGERAENTAVPMPVDGDDDDDEGDGAESDEDEGDDAGEDGGSLSEQEIQDLIEQALQEAREARNEDSSLTSDVKSYNESKGAGSQGTPLERVVPVVNTDPEAIREADMITNQVRNLIEEARAETAPSWQEGQREGVLDIMRYKTREVGDMEFFRRYADDGDMQLPNMAVSVILDGSGSMLHADDALGVTAYAMKSACDMAGIPCTVTIHDTGAYLVYDQDDRPYEVHHNFIPGGGTIPTEALDMLDHQMADKDRHLVILMTDGAWQGNVNLADYRLPNRDIVIFYYNTAPTRMRGHETATHYRLDDLTDMARHLTRFIVRAL